MELHGFKFEGKNCVSVKIHDNRFISNHLFLSARGGEPNMTIRVESNDFILAESPADGHAMFRRIPSDMQRRIISERNAFAGMKL